MIDMPEERIISPLAGTETNKLRYVRTINPDVPGRFGETRISGGRIRELDCLRAFGIVSVVLGHFRLPGKWPNAMHLIDLFGWIAMDSFFVLSGFLITGILLDSRSSPDYYRTFYIRRTLRIFPLYYVVIITATCLMLFRGGGRDFSSFVASWGTPLWFFVYLGSVRIVATGSFAPGPFAPLWSLQIEEQFYLLFPLVVRRLRPETLVRLLWALVFLSPLLRLALYWAMPGNVALQSGLLPCRMEGLALGALIAIRFRAGPWRIVKWRLTCLTAVVLGTTCVCGALNGYIWATSGFNRTFGVLLSSFGCACLLLWLITFRGTLWTGWLRVSPITFVAKISYGIYLLHMPALLTVVKLADTYRWRFYHLTIFPAAIGLTAVLSVTSWYLLEQPLYRLRDRWTSPPGPASG